ncbi:hypothetical protein MPTK1_7g08960 [Marchantia polymorpha subsp. ruderalis]|uniref:Uncharacterized protein n=2 Tax=Marchantia polymorpha TaxID=3197 RepID=A0AAF6BXL7_MARPO|nr:hypothetical protein MARPO_0068s0049 [Marchantia polymorpha]BBN16751.1 hypothetical protein Mp_7g08960 [Marchantia polymorpha subsp. ruderalis]|eukprot:PTQ35833.1 hypothetical protein MARPO_0068s0049 [Marchantia polymorpha]
MPCADIQCQWPYRTQMTGFRSLVRIFRRVSHPFRRINYPLGLSAPRQVAVFVSLRLDGFPSHAIVDRK